MTAWVEMRPLTLELHRLVAADDRAPALAWDGVAPEVRHCNGWGFAAFVDGELVGMGGLVPYWHGHAEAWLAVRRSIGARQLVPALRVGRQWLDGRQALPAFRRLQAYIRCSEPWCESFARAMGFELEGVLRAWGPDGSDHALYGRVR
jgi:hypothetical protein